MKGLRIIPLFLLLMVLTYVGMLFVESNHDAVTVTFASYQSPPTALGFVVLTSVLIGMVVSGVLCSIEILALTVRNRKLKRKLAAFSPQPRRESPTALDTPAPQDTAGVRPLSP